MVGNVICNDNAMKLQWLKKWVILEHIEYKTIEKLMDCKEQ